MARRIMRSLWANGELVTHHRQNGRHYYDRSARVIPAEHFTQPPLLNEDEYFRWILARRFQATGLLRPNAEAVVWSVCGDQARRKRALAELVEAGQVVPVLAGAEKLPYYAWAEALRGLEEPAMEPQVLLLAPLDSLLWDRKGVQQLFGFDYVWEVYKPGHQRKFGYYTLPVLWGDRLVARFDGKLDRATNTFVILGLWLEDETLGSDEAFAQALARGFARFAAFLGASRINAEAIPEPLLRQAVGMILT